MQLIKLFSAALGEPNQELEPQLETSQDTQLEIQQETKLEGGLEVKPEKDLETKPNRNLDRKLDGSLENLEGGLEAKPEKNLETKLDRNLDRKSDRSPEKPEENLEKLGEKPEGDSGNPVGRLDKLGGYGKVRSPRAALRAASPSPRVTAGMGNIYRIDDVIISVSEKIQDTQLETQQETKPEGGSEAKLEKDPERRPDRNLDQKSDESLEKLGRKPEGDSGGGWLREGNIKGSDGKAADEDGQTPLHDAARAVSHDTVHWLIDQGADVHDAARAGSEYTVLTKM